jgi:membrane protein implicated in regulation of membrane protease activity
MSPFWASLFDGLKDRGRNATVFIIALGVFFACVFIAAGIAENIASSSDIYDYAKPALRCLVVLAVFLLCLAIRQAFSRRKRRRPNFSRLSSDELAKARSKLLKDRNLKNL